MKKLPSIIKKHFEIPSDIGFDLLNSLKGTVAWDFWTLFLSWITKTYVGPRFTNLKYFHFFFVEIFTKIVSFYSNIRVGNCQISRYHYPTISKFPGIITRRFFNLWVTIYCCWKCLGIVTCRFYNLQVTIPGNSLKKQLSWKNPWNHDQIWKISGYRYPENDQLSGIHTRKWKISRYHNSEIFYNFWVRVLWSWEISRYPYPEVKFCVPNSATFY